MLGGLKAQADGQVATSNLSYEFLFPENLISSYLSNKLGIMSVGLIGLILDLPLAAGCSSTNSHHYDGEELHRGPNRQIARTKTGFCEHDSHD